MKVVHCLVETKIADISILAAFGWNQLYDEIMLSVYNHDPLGGNVGMHVLGQTC